MCTIDEEWAEYLKTIDKVQFGFIQNKKFDESANQRILLNTQDKEKDKDKSVDKDKDKSADKDKDKSADKDKSVLNTSTIADGDAKKIPIQVPLCDELYISTKTKVLYLNQPVDIQRIFWLIPISEYSKQEECIIKKQMKIVSKTKEEYEEYKLKLEGIPYYIEHIIKQIDNPSARRLKFKDERKITIGISKKDIMNCRGKVKNAFYNCFAMILRFSQGGVFKEIHVKIFNTGKLEIPGILNNELLTIVKRMILSILQPHIDTPLHFINVDSEDNVLINSNFNCGFFINRDKLQYILSSEKYGIETAYDSCSYPGVKCKYYYNNDIPVIESHLQTGRVNMEDRKMKMSELVDNKKYTEISFMIFRTGSCLIVGNCSETVLRHVFAFIKNMLENEYSLIFTKNDVQNTKIKKTKLRKKIINITQDYYTNFVKKTARVNI